MFSCLPSCVTDLLKGGTSGGGTAADFVEKVWHLKDIDPSEIASGMKNALTQGVDASVKRASALDGFNGNSILRIPFPADAERVASTLRSMGMGSQVDQFELQMNRGAEQAALQAAPVFVSAIQNLTFNDVLAIMRGDNDAATQYLKRTTTPELQSRFQPIVGKALDSVAATKYYEEIVSKYNMIPLVKKVDTDLNQYVTGRAIDGLFVYVAEEEARIREDPAARTTDLLKKIYGAIKD